MITFWQTSASRIFRWLSVFVTKSIWKRHLFPIYAHYTTSSHYSFSLKLSFSETYAITIWVTNLLPTGYWTRLPWPHPPMGRARIIIAASFKFGRLVGILTHYVINDCRCSIDSIRGLSD